MAEDTGSEESGGDPDIGGAGRAEVAKSRITLVEVTVHAQAVGHGGVQHLDLVGVLGREADLQPVVHVQAPGGRGLAQLLEAAQAAVGHAHTEGLAVWLIADLPVMVTTIDERVPWGPGQTGQTVCSPSCSPGDSSCPSYSLDSSYSLLLSPATL